MKKLLKAVKRRMKSKTYRAGFITSLLVIAEAQQQVISSLVPASWEPYMPLALPVIFLIVREFTNEAIGDKEA